MNCLQCNKPARENGEVYNGIKIRECEDKHRTALYVKAYKRKKYAKAYKTKTRLKAA